MNEGQLNNTKHTQAVAEEISKYLNITFTPGGLYDFTQSKKQPIGKYAMHRSSTATWAKYPTDTVAKHFLDGNYVVVDIDSPDVYVDGILTIVYNNTTYQGTLPETFNTTTTAPYKKHYYYSTHHLSPSQREVLLTRRKCDGVDLLGLGPVFEGHARTTQAIDYQPVAPLPEWIYDIFTVNYTKSYDSKLVPVSKPGPASLVKAYLKDPDHIDPKLMTTLVKVCAAATDLPDKRKLTLKDIPLSHTAMNNVAVKLTMIAELGHTEHVIPLMNSIIEAHGKDSQSSESQARLGNFFSTLHSHEPIDVDDDNSTLSFYELCQQQKGAVAVFRAARERDEYIVVDKMTYTPIPVEAQSNTFHRSLSALEMLFPQYRRQSEDGRKTWYEWPVFPPIQLDFDIKGPRVLPATNSLQLLRLNAYTPPVYKTDAEPVHNTNGLIYRALLSLTGPNYIDYMVHWMAYAVFSPHGLIGIPTVVSSAQGTGKSFHMWKLLHFLTGACYSIGATSVAKGWGDAFENSAALCFDDLGKLSTAEWNKFYAPIKNMTNGGAFFLDIKGKGMKAVEVSINMTITSNEMLPHISQDDRRLFCLEPAFLTEPELALSAEDSAKLEHIRRSPANEVVQEIQEFANHLYYIYTTTSTKYGMCKDAEMNGYLFNKVPETKWRHEWITGSSTHSRNLYTYIAEPDNLMSLIKEDYKEDYMGVLSDHIEMIVISYQPKTSHVGLSWYWFKDMLPLVMSKRHDGISIRDVENWTGVQTTKNVGINYVEAWKTHTNEDMHNHKAQGYIIPVSLEAIVRYKEILKELRN